MISLLVIHIQIEWMQECFQCAKKGKRRYECHCWRSAEYSCSAAADDDVKSVLYYQQHVAAQWDRSSLRLVFLMEKQSEKKKVERYFIFKRETKSMENKKVPTSEIVMELSRGAPSYTRFCLEGGMWMFSAILTFTSATVS